MSTGKGGLFRNRKFSDVHNFYKPDIVSWMDSPLAVRQAVNQTIGLFNIKEWTVNIEANIHDLSLLQVNISLYRLDFFLPHFILYTFFS